MPIKHPAYYQTWGANLRKRRLELGMSQVALAKRLRVHQTAVSQWELGTTAPGVELQARLCRLMGRRQSTLFPLPKLRSFQQRKVAAAK